MMIDYNKQKIKQSLSQENIFQLLEEFAGEPETVGSIIVAKTICHNPLSSPASRKLYYYPNSFLFHCYTGGCEHSSFDVFELIIKVMKLQYNQDYDLNDAVRWIAQKFGISGQQVNSSGDSDLEDWEKLNNYDRIQDIKLNRNTGAAIVTLKEYDNNILDRFNYNVVIGPWLKEGISQEAMEDAKIGYYPGGDQITIPHFDRDDRFIGLRGRTLCQSDADKFGKYRPLKINKELYNHPLGMNLYNLNKSQDMINFMGKAIVVESEKSCLQYKSYFGIENDISVACCGSNISAFQINLLLEAGAKEIIIAFDRQFQKIGDNEFLKLKAHLLKIYKKYNNLVNISFIFDKEMITSYKSSPLDEGKEKFLYLYKNRIIL